MTLEQAALLRDVVTVTTVVRLADNSTAPITITRGAAEHSWGVVPQDYHGARCKVCDMPLFKCGLCEYHFGKARSQERKG